jgi:hypothetical protein
VPPQGAYVGSAVAVQQVHGQWDANCVPQDKAGIWGQIDGGGGAC